MKMVYTTILLVCLSACAPKCHNAQVSIDPALEPYVDRFVSDAKAQGVELDITNLIVQFGDLGPAPAQGSGADAEIGFCEWSATPTITINNNPNALNHWALADDRFHEWAMYHELGHCVLNRGHTSALWTALDGSSEPESIMYPYAPNLSEYGANRAHYVEELFD